MLTKAATSANRAPVDPQYLLGVLRRFQGLLVP
jgi:hypothetical protein